MKSNIKISKKHAKDLELMLIFASFQNNLKNNKDVINQWIKNYTDEANKKSNRF